MKFHFSMRLRSRVDSNQKQLVSELRAIGVGVIHLHQLAHGVPDLLCVYHNKLYLMEVKGKKGKLTTDQIEFMSKWKGKIHIVTCLTDCLTIFKEMKG